MSKRARRLLGRLSIYILCYSVRLATGENTMICKHPQEIRKKHEHDRNGDGYTDQVARHEYGRGATSALNVLHVTGVSRPRSQQVVQTIRRYRLLCIG